MAEDLATLGLTLDNSSMVAAAEATGAALDRMGVRGTTAARTIQVMSAPVSAAILAQATAAQQAAGQFFTLEQAAEAETAAALAAARGAAVVNTEVAKHTGIFTKIARSFEHFIVNAIGANAQVGQIAAGMAHMELGQEALLGGLAALAVGVLVYKSWTEDTRKARAEQDKLTKSLEEWYSHQRTGAGGTGLAQQLVAERARLTELRHSLDDVTTGLTMVGAEGSRASAWVRILTAGGPAAIIKQYGIEVARGMALTTKAINTATGAIGAGEKELVKLTTERARENDKVRALNDAYDQSEIALEQLQIEQDGVIQRSRDAADHYGEELIKLNALTDANVKLRLEQSRLNAQKNINRKATDDLNDVQDRMDLLTKIVPLERQRAQIDQEWSKQRIENERRYGGPGNEKLLASANEYAKALRDAKMREAQLSDALRPALNLLDGMQEGVANFAADLFSKPEQAFRNLAEALKSIWRQLIADLARMEIERHILPRVAGAVFGAALPEGSTGGGSGLIGAAVSAASNHPYVAAATAVIATGAALLGMADSAHKAAKAAREAARAFELSLASFAADAAGPGSDEALHFAILQAEADKAALNKQIDSMRQGQNYAGTHYKGNAEASAAEQADFDKVARLTERRIELLKEEAEALKRTRIEDLQVRLLRAKGQTREADALALQHDQERERKELIQSFGEQIDATEAATLRLLLQVQAQEKLKAATDAASKSALNMVEGYKLQSVIFGAAGVGKPNVSAPSADDGDLHLTLNLDGEVVSRSVLKNFKRRSQRQFGTMLKWGQIQ